MRWFCKKIWWALLSVLRGRPFATFAVKLFAAVALELHSPTHSSYLAM
jgi:hypothetical protein